jgi:hypothetical protein
MLVGSILNYTSKCAKRLKKKAIELSANFKTFGGINIFNLYYKAARKKRQLNK